MIRVRNEDRVDRTAVVDELGPPQYSATLQAVFLFGIHVLGNATAPPVVGWFAMRAPVSLSLLTAVAAFGVSGALFVIVAGRQRRAVAAGHPFD